MRIIKYFFLAILSVPFIGCEKAETFNNTDTHVGISRVTNFPILTVTGAEYIPISMGGAYVEPGVTAVEGGATIPVTTTGTVNTSTPGVYHLVYSAVNKDGYSASASRNVVVYSTAPDAAANDFSGNYARTTNGSVATWTKIAPGVYSVFNPGGAPGTSLTVIVFNSAGLTIDIPAQITNDGNTTSSTDEVYDSGATPPRYSWKIVNPGYGTALRTFVKQ